MGKIEASAGKAPGRGRAWIQLDRKALAYNVAELNRRLPPGCRLMPAVKANAYGHGAAVLVPELEKLGVDSFCVATAWEGAELRQAGIRGEILVLGCTGPEDFWLLSEYNLIQTAADAAHAALLDTWGKPLRIHIKLDTGMNRLGERWENLEAVTGIFRRKNLRVEGIYTHLAPDDPTDPRSFPLVRMQRERFYQAAAALEARGFSCGKKHLLASVGLFHWGELGGDYARVGLALYGVGEPGLHPVLSLHARVALVKTLRAGEGAGYGPAFRAKKDMRLAVLPIGYGDGLPRVLSLGRGAALLHGRKAPILGRVCMDQTLIDVTDIPSVQPGDTAVLLGRSGNCAISAKDLAVQAGTIPNEILSRLGSRLPRLLADK